MGFNPFTGRERSTDSTSIKPKVEQSQSPSILSATGSADTNPYIVESITDNELLTIEDVSPQLSPEGRIPLLLIHGWNFDGKPAPPGTGYWEYFKNYLMNDPELSGYFKPYYVKYWSNAVSVKELGGLLRDKIELAGLHEQPLVLIGHSMGGLVSRSFMSEYSFNTGINAGKKCGDIVKLLITLGTAHHGSPMANGPARDDKAGFPFNLYFPIIEEMVFSEIHYNELNRSDLRWDNYDGLLNYTKFPNEKNDWLTNLNAQTVYDPKLICYAATVTGVLNLNPTGIDEQFKVGSYLMKESFGFNNDGIVPIKSSSFVGHTPKKIRTFSEYNHADIVRGKGDGSVLFNPLKEDLLEIVPPQLLSPTTFGICFKYSQSREILWKAPSTMQKVNLYFSGDNGQSYSLLADNIDAGLSAFQWSVPDTNLTQCLIKITNASNEDEFTCSSNTFTIYHNRVFIEKPKAKTYFIPDHSNTISWQQFGISPWARLTYHDPKNNFEKVIAEEYPVSQQTNTFGWEIDNTIPPTDSAFITIELLNMSELYGDEENYIFTSPTFMMLGEPGIIVTAPSTFPSDEFGKNGEKMVIDSSYTIRWQTEGEIKYVRISLCDSLKNFIREIRKKNHQPGIHSKGSYIWKIPEFYGDKFYLLFEAGPDQNTISTSACTAYPFRINRNTNIVNPLNGYKDVSLLPCLQIDSVKNATGYIFEISDSATRGTNYFRTFNSGLPELCLPNTVANELLPGVTYQFLARAMIDTMKSYPSRTFFQTLKEKPFTFKTLEPIEDDTIEGISLTFNWNRAIGAQEYQIEIIHQKKIIFSGTVLRSDTTLKANLGKSGMADTLFWKVTARNDYGETIAESYFFKKNRSGLIPLVLGEKENYNLINYPNPFETETTFEYILPGSTKTYQTEITVYNLTGHKIRTLSKTEKTSGLQKVIWDGKDESGIRVERGIYIGFLTIDQQSVMRSIIVK
jgi:pimeloyl-ACP methyl ester carboxylesterase